MSRSMTANETAIGVLLGNLMLKHWAERGCVLPGVSLGGCGLRLLFTRRSCLLLPGVFLPLPAQNSPGKFPALSKRISYGPSTRETSLRVISCR